MAKKKGNNFIIDRGNKTAKLELNRRKGDNLWTVIDLKDLDRVVNFPYTWTAKYDPDLDQFYVEASVYCGCKNGKKLSKSVKLHKFIMDAKEDEVVDHINHDTLDNTKGNLRIIPHKNNSMNRKSRNSNNKSGYRNVCWNKSENKWIVQLQVNKKNTVLGKFPKDQLIEAARFAEEKRKELYGEFAGFN